MASRKIWNRSQRREIKKEQKMIVKDQAKLDVDWR